MLGLGRPSLKSRPSLLDLIQADTVHADPAVVPNDLVDEAVSTPLDNNSHHHHHHSDASDSASTAGEPNNLQLSSPPSSSSIMPSKDSKKAQHDDGDEQKGKVYSISGPIIVAEDMLGCAMYELVGGFYSCSVLGRPW